MVFALAHLSTSSIGYASTPLAFPSSAKVPMPGTRWISGDVVAQPGGVPSAAPASTPSGCSSPGDDDRCERWVTTVARDVAGVELGANQASDSAMSPDGAVVYVTGGASQTTGDIFTAAVDVATGITLWQTAFDASPLGEGLGSKVAVSPDGLTIAVVGTGIRSGPLGEIYTVAYEAATGRLLWSATYTTNIGVPDVTPSPPPLFVGWVGDGNVTFTSDGTAVVITGNVKSSNGDDDGVVVAYEVANGDVRWTNVAGGPGYQSTGGAVSAGNDVYTIGQAQGSPESSGRVTFNATATRFDGRTGDVVWTASVSLRYSASPMGLAIDPSGKRLFATHTASPQNGNGVAWGTLAYDTATGTNLWLSRHEGDYPGAPSYALPTGIAAGPEVLMDNGVRQSRVYVTGMVINEQANGYDFGTIAYDAETGGKLFEARYGTERDERPWAIAISADGSRVFTTGRNGPPYGGGPSGGTAVEPMTISYDGATGAQLWVARYLTASGEGGDPIGVNASADGSRVVTAGNVVYAQGATPNTHTRDFLILGYLD